MTAREPTPNAQLAAFLSRYSPETAALVKRCLPKIRRVFPGLTQLVYDYANSNYLVVSFALSERGYEGIVALGVSPRWVRLYFNDGKTLPDPQGRLEGSASKVRHVTLEAASDLDHADIRALFKAASKQSGVILPRSRSSRMVIKSASKKSKPKPKKSARA